MTPPAVLRFPAAAVIPRRKDGLVLVGRRTAAARSYPEYLAFPGGGCDDTDLDLPLIGGEDDPGARACAMRELGEETGRWILVDAHGQAPDRLKTERFCQGVAAGEDLRELLLDAGLSLDARGLIPLGLWHTSDGRPRQFSVRQFLLPVGGDEAVVRTPPHDELNAVGWMDPADLKRAWRRGDALLLPPIRHCIEQLAAGHKTEEALVAALKDIPTADAPRLRDIVEGIAVHPYRTPTLPPATHTNCVLVGTGDFLVIDPATPYDDERAAFDELLALLASRGRRPRAVVLTHHHIDHVGDAERVAQQYGIEVWAHRITAELVDFPVHRHLDDGEVLVCEGPAPRRLRALFTPGHAPGHLCFLEEETRVLIAGDMVAGVGSILIDPSEGHMGTYLASLARLLEASPKRLVPAHGPLLADARARLLEHVQHREQRQEQVAAALAAEGGWAAPLDLVPGVYGADVQPALAPLAARSVLAALLLLVERGEAEQDGERFRAAALPAS